MAKCLTTSQKDLEMLISTASKPAQLLQAKAIQHIQKAAKNKWLRSLDFTTNKSIDRFLVELGVVASPMQVRAFVRDLQPVDCSGFMSFREMVNKGESLENLMSVVLAQLANALETLGIGVVGSEEVMAQMILDEYDNWTVADVMKFFTMAANSEFKGDMQHLTVRGLSFEFFTDWVKQYEALRSEGFAEINRTLKFRKDEKDVDFKALLAGQAAGSEVVEQMRKDAIKKKQMQAKQAQIKSQWQAKFKADAREFVRVNFYNYLVFGVGGKDKLDAIVDGIMQQAAAIADSQFENAKKKDELNKAFPIAKETYPALLYASANHFVLELKALSVGYLTNYGREGSKLNAAMQARHGILTYCKKQGIVDGWEILQLLGYEGEQVEVVLGEAIDYAIKEFVQMAKAAYNPYLIKATEGNWPALSEPEFLHQYLRQVQMDKLGWCVLFERYSDILGADKKEE